MVLPEHSVYVCVTTKKHAWESNNMETIYITTCFRNCSIVYNSLLQCLHGSFGLMASNHKNTSKDDQFWRIWTISIVYITLLQCFPFLVNHMPSRFTLHICRTLFTWIIWTSLNQLCHPTGLITPSQGLLMFQTLTSRMLWSMTEADWHSMPIHMVLVQ